MTDHATANYYDLLLLIMYVSSSVNYCRLQTSTTASVQRPPHKTFVRVLYANQHVYVQQIQLSDRYMFPFEAERFAKC